MLTIFSDMIEHCLEVFINNFTMFENSFDDCLDNLEIKNKKDALRKNLC